MLTLALGVGGTAAVYGVARGLLFDSLPYAHAQVALAVRSHRVRRCSSAPSRTCMQSIAGFRTEGVGIVDVTMGGSLSFERRQQTIDELTAALAALPRGRSAAAVQTLPLRDGGYGVTISCQGVRYRKGWRRSTEWSHRAISRSWGSRWSTGARSPRQTGPTRRVFEVTAAGVRALADTYAMRERLWRGVDLKRPLIRP